MDRWKKYINSRWSRRRFYTNWYPDILTKPDEEIFDYEKEESEEIELKYVFLDEIPDEYKKQFTKWIGNQKIKISRRIKKNSDQEIIIDQTRYGAKITDWIKWLKWRLGETEVEPNPGDN